MALIIINDVTVRVLTMEAAVDAMERVHKQFTAAGQVVYGKAREQGLRMDIPVAWFQQYIAN